MPLLVGMVSRAETKSASTGIATANIDTAKVHKSLRAAINDFQDEWRKAWKTSQNETHPPINLIAIRGIDGAPGDRELGNLTTDLRRYLSMICFINSPSEGGFGAIRRRTNLRNTGTRTQSPSQMKRPQGSDAIKEESGISWATPRQITPRPNVGAQCPQWIPPEAGVPPDEGEAIDLALKEKYRDAIRRRRDVLIRFLDSAQTQFPEDYWIAGQRVRFVYDQRDAERTLAAARTCRGDLSFCAALVGLAFQQTGNTAAAEEEFRRSDSVSASNAQNRKQCFDTTMLWLIRSGDRSAVADVSCERQPQTVENLWWLADPLWSVPGNERYVEHGSRRIQATLHAIDERDERYPWFQKGGGDAMRELVIRYGWPTYTYWPGSQLENEMDQYLDGVRFPPRFVARPYTSKEYNPDRTAFIPRAHAFADPFNLTDDDWELTRPGNPDDWWPAEHMAYLTRIVKLPEGQTAAWRRDTNIVYQLAVDDPRRALDTASSAPSRAELIGGTSSHATGKLAETSIGIGHTMRLKASIPSSPIVLSAEVLPRTPLDQAMRSRFAFHPPPALRDMKKDEYAISDPVFMRLPNREMTVPTSESDVLRFMAGSLAFSANEQLALYWESYGFIPGDTIQFELKFKRVDEVNVARRIGSFLGVASAQRDSVTIKWTEPDARHAATELRFTKPTVGRALAVDLKALQPGAYAVSIEMRKSNKIAARSERLFTIRSSK
ncbi:MAG: hypothetical protein ABJB74_20000 [Gemmatimonas sp.]